MLRVPGYQTALRCTCSISWFPHFHPRYMSAAASRTVSTRTRIPPMQSQHRTKHVQHSTAQHTTAQHCIWNYPHHLAGRKFITCISRATLPVPPPSHGRTGTYNGVSQEQSACSRRRTAHALCSHPRVPDSSRSCEVSGSTGEKGGAEYFKDEPILAG